MAKQKAAPEKAKRSTSNAKTVNVGKRKRRDSKKNTSGCLVLIAIGFALYLISQNSNGLSSSERRVMETGSAAQQAMTADARSGTAAAQKVIVPTAAEVITESETIGQAIQQSASNTAITFPLETGMKFQLERFEMFSDAGDLKPDNGTFLVMYAILRNPTKSSHCIYARDVRMVLDGEEYAPQDGAMGAVQTVITPKRDYIGPVAGHCVPASASVATFAVFDVPATVEEAALKLYKERHDLEVTWSVPSSVVAAEPTVVPPTEALPTTVLRPTETVAAVQATPVAPTAAPASGVHEQAAQTYYTIRNVNVRSCEKSTCNKITTLSGGTAVVMTGWVQGENVNGTDIWYRVDYNGQIAYIHSSFLSANAPAPTAVMAQSSQGQDQMLQPVQPGQEPVQPAMSTVPPQPAVTWDCTIDYNCPYFENKCDQLRSYWAACPGDPSRLDKAGEGVPGIPCEKQCGTTW